MKFIELGGDLEEREHAQEKGWLKVGPEPVKLRPHEMDTWKVFFGMGLAAGVLLFGAKSPIKGGKGYIP